jgi:hypothetical protein
VGTVSTSSNTARRSLHLVDLENLVGDPCATGGLVRETLDNYLVMADWQPGDHVIIASNPSIIREVSFELPAPANVHATRGEDGADVMLLSLAPPEFVARRYRRLVIGSGDGIFAARARATTELGVQVLVVAREGGCSRRLQRFEHRLLAREAGRAVA